MLVDLGKTHSSEMASWKLAYGFISYNILWIMCNNLEHNGAYNFNIYNELNSSEIFALSNKSFINRHIKLLSFFCKEKLSLIQ